MKYISLIMMLSGYRSSCLGFIIVSQHFCSRNTIFYNGKEKAYMLCMYKRILSSSNVIITSLAKEVMFLVALVS